MHPFKPYLFCSFTDGFIRFFDLTESKLIGRCEIHTGSADSQKVVTDVAVALKVLPDGCHLYAATKNGQVVLITVEGWFPLSIRMESLLQLKEQIHSFEYSVLEPFNKWLATTTSGRIHVFVAKEANPFHQQAIPIEKNPEFAQVDQFDLCSHVNGKPEVKGKISTLDKYYAAAKNKEKKVEFAETKTTNACEAVFAINDPTVHISFIKT